MTGRARATRLSEWRGQDRLDSRVVSARESWLDPESPVRPLLVAIFGWVAEQERTRRSFPRRSPGSPPAKEEGGHGLP